MLVLVVGGGSAGHVIPALPVIERLQSLGSEVCFVGTTSGLEEELVANASVEFHSISSGKLRRYWSWQNVTDVLRIALGVLQSLLLLGRLRPSAVFSKGGFVSFPIALASWVWRIPLVVHESDVTPGLANRLVKPFARTICTSFAATEKYLPGVRVVHAGTPLRSEIVNGDSSAGRASLGIGADQSLLVVTGGSLGAINLNEALAEALPTLTQQHFVLHICGRGKRIDMEMANYQQREYVADGWGDLLAAADVVISRAGANALFELLALRKPNILVPLDAQSSRGDQLENAEFAKNHGLSFVIEPMQLSGSALVDAIDTLESGRSDYEAALAAFGLPAAATTIANEILAASRNS